MSRSEYSGSAFRLVRRPVSPCAEALRAIQSKLRNPNNGSAAAARAARRQRAELAGIAHIETPTIGASRRPHTPPQTLLTKPLARMKRPGRRGQSNKTTGRPTSGSTAHPRSKRDPSQTRGAEQLERTSTWTASKITTQRRAPRHPHLRQYDYAAQDGKQMH